MEECFKCHTPETRAILFEVISPEGIVKVCGKCYGKENFPLVNKGSSFKIYKEKSVYERMLKISGTGSRKIEPFEIKKQDFSLKRIVNENLEKNLNDFSNNPEDKKGFFYNFHWIVMRGRRNKHLTQEQLADAIREPERVVKLIEKGYVPKDRSIIRRIEEFLNVRLRREVPENEKAKYFLISKTHESTEGKDMESSKINSEGYLDIKEGRNIRISDLQELKKMKEREIFDLSRKKIDNKRDDFSEDDVEIIDEFGDFEELIDEPYDFDKEERGNK
ncbi:hypothetical protein COU59_02740 [Candidatus Pacearchaeota archaeon CG10_big_fil_rev_8_21_14_0_10_34_12]|nr:MAG: hypothetical protein COU59_02740 [Candidatus Pacearchaeota archaeon CG10_big_fil_rev_8_21_14_0_10_34_12]